MANTRKQPIYKLAHGIQILNENKTGKYVMLTIDAPQKLFPNSTPSAQGHLYVQRARVVMTAKIGRALKRSEHVHHKNEKQKHNDSIRNLEVLTSREHNQHHKTGTRHKAEVKVRIAQSLRDAYASGRKKPVDTRGKKNPFYGKRHTEEAKLKMSRARRKRA